ncbi:MAG: hypothetical protein WCZ23_12145 [Rhodospirillaceae bacterium]
MARLTLRTGFLALALMTGALPAAAQQAPPMPSLTSPVIQPKRAQDPLLVPNFRDGLRETVETLSTYGKGRSRSFVIVIRQGLGLLIHSTWEAKLQSLVNEGKEDFRPVAPGTLKRRFVQSIDGVVLDGQFCADPVTASQGYLDLIRESALVGLVVDHCGTPEAASDAYTVARTNGLLPHVDSGTGPLGRIPAGAPFGENSDNVTSLGKARNILVVDQNETYATKQDWLLALRRTNHDVLVLDPFHRNREPLSNAEVAELKTKHLGSRRLVLARLHVSEAVDTHWYWKRDWVPGEPVWLGEELPNRPGVHAVQYWHPAWRALIGQAFSGLMELGFDGVMLEGMEAYEPLEASVELE